MFVFRGVQLAFPRCQVQVQEVGNTEVGLRAEVIHSLDEMEAYGPRDAVKSAQTH